MQHINMYRHSPVRNQRSKGIKTKHVVQICLLLAVCFWLLFQLKRSHDKKKEFDSTISHETLKFGRKDLVPKLEETATGGIGSQLPQEQEDEVEEETKHDEEDQDEEDKIEDGGGGGDDEIDEKSNMEIDRDEVDIIDDDDDKETEEGEENESENEEKDGGSEIESRVVEEDGSTHEAREEHYKADDASSAVITRNPEMETQNGTLDDDSSHLVHNGTVSEEKDLESMNAMNPSSGHLFDSNATPNMTKNSGMLRSNGEEQEEDNSESENLETNNEEDPTHLEVQTDLEMLPEIETDTASE